MNLSTAALAVLVALTSSASASTSGDGEVNNLRGSSGSKKFAPTSRTLKVNPGGGNGGGNGNGNGNGNGGGNGGIGGNSSGRGAAKRAFDVKDIAGPGVAAILSGEQSVPSDDTSEAGLIFTTMAKLAVGGVSYEDMEQEMAARGYHTPEILQHLDSHVEMRENVMNLMRGLQQKEMVENLSKKDDDAIKGSSKHFDAFGNSARGPDRLKPNPPGPPDFSKPRGSGSASGFLGGSPEGPGTGSAKPKPTLFNDGNRHLVEVPDGCSVANPSWVGDGWCDKSGGYNTEECGWDGGDCCDFTCVNDLKFVCGYNGFDCKSCSVTNPDWVGDGWCDSGGGYNSAGCGWDGGDCCEQTCKDGDYTCGSWGYSCECEPTDVILAPQPDPGRYGPGFKILNDTPWPVEISLWQVGPLYWQLVQPGQWFYEKTGAVWFTVKATINIDNEPTIDIWDAIWPIANIVAGVLLAIISAGTASALSASVAAGGAAGSISATIVVKIASVLVGMGLKAKTALYVSTAAVAATKEVLTNGDVYIPVIAAVAENFVDLPGSWTAVSDYGTYAGYPWPFKKETQSARVHGGLVFEPAHLDNQCVNVFRKDISSDLKVSCTGGSCFLG